MAKSDLLNHKKAGGDGVRYLITDASGAADIGSNKVIGTFPQIEGNLSIAFCGEGNILYFADGIKNLCEVSIRFEGDNSLIYLSGNVSGYSMQIDMHSNGVCYMGRDLFNNMTERLHITVRDKDRVCIGNDCLFSLRIRMDTLGSDGRHGDIMIGNHVWIGQDVSISGHTVIDSGAVIGAETVIDGGSIPSNSCWASRRGVLTEVRSNVIFTKDGIKNTPAHRKQLFDTISSERKQQILDLTSENGFAQLKGSVFRRSAQSRLDHINKAAEIREYHKPKRFRQPTAADDAAEFGYPDNRIIGEYAEEGRNTVKFNGSGNVLICEDGVTLKGCQISFDGNNALIYLSKSSRPYHMVLVAHNDATVVIGPESSIAPGAAPARIDIAEAKSFITGRGISIGDNTWVRTSDQHPMFDLETGTRVNPARSIILGDGAAFGDNGLIKKGKKINVNDDDRGRALLQASEALDGTTDMKERMDIAGSINA